MESPEPCDDIHTSKVNQTCYHGNTYCCHGGGAYRPTSPVFILKSPQVEVEEGRVAPVAKPPPPPSKLPDGYVW